MGVSECTNLGLSETREHLEGMADCSCHLWASMCGTHSPQMQGGVQPMVVGQGCPGGEHGGPESLRSWPTGHGGCHPQVAVQDLPIVLWGKNEHGGAREGFLGQGAEAKARLSQEAPWPCSGPG